MWNALRLQVMKDNIDELIECAIREKSLLEDMKKIDSTMHRSKRLHVMTYIAVACLALALCLNISLYRISMAAGNSYIPSLAQRGSSEITALMQENRLDEAIERINAAKTEVNARLPSPELEDADYRNQLRSDIQELDLLEAICRLRKGQYLRGRKILKCIVNAGGAWSEDAGKLLEEL